jgi:hypothetical protein
MGEEGAKETNIPNADLAHFHLRAMGIRAEDMQTNIKGIVERIAHLESGKPWGHKTEYADAFEKEYHAGSDKGGGADFIRKNAHTLGDETMHGLALADWALTNSVDLDTSSAALYQTDGTEALGNGMVTTQNAMADNAKKVQEQQEADK